MELTEVFVGAEVLLGEVVLQLLDQLPLQPLPLQRGRARVRSQRSLQWLRSVEEGRGVHHGNKMACQGGGREGGEEEDGEEKRETKG